MLEGNPGFRAAPGTVSALVRPSSRVDEVIKTTNLFNNLDKLFASIL